MAGREMKNEYFALRNAPIPNTRASDIVDPDRERPGKTADPRRRKRSTASNVPRCRRMSNASSGSVSPSIFCARNRWPELLTGRNSVAPWRIPSSIALNTVNGNPSRDFVPGGFHGFFHHAADPVYGFPVLSLEPEDEHGLRVRRDR